ncbi:MAG: hypothetical protein ABL921_15760 [Pirellula sp.]
MNKLPKDAWPLLGRLLALFSVLAAAIAIIYVFEASIASIQKSDAWADVATEPNQATLSQAWPKSARKFQFARSSIGMGGRFCAYAVDGAPDDLDDFAKNEFLAHWNKPKAEAQFDQPSPFDAGTISFLEKAYRVKLTWLLAPESSRGTVYRDSEKGSSQSPTIFVDRTNGMLYSVITD